MTKEINYKEPLEISDSSFVSSLAITKTAQGFYEGKAVCFEVGPDGGGFNLEWRAKLIEGKYEIMPTKREGIELDGMLQNNQFTHSRHSDAALRDYISQEIGSFD